MKTLVFPELRQVYNFDCGASALQSVLVYYGIEDFREDELMKMAGTTAKDGTTPGGIVKVLQSFGFAVFEGPLTIVDLVAAIELEQPVILALQAYRDDPSIPYAKCWDDGHYVVAIGFDGQRVLFEDPSSYKRTWLSFEQLNERWHDVGATKKDRLEHWGCIVGSEPKFQPNESQYMA
jgi:predicted double-glycine peptidase